MPGGNCQFNSRSGLACASRCPRLPLSALAEALENQRVDVLIPHFNDADGLRATLASVAAQTWEGPVRLVVVDDGSTREQLAQVRAMLGDASAELLENQRNRGRPYTRNRLLSAIDSPWVTWLDAGDIWYPQKLEAQLERACELAHAGKRLDDHWITCDYDWKWQGRPLHVVVQEIGGDSLSKLLVGKELRAYLWTLLGSAQSMRKAGAFDEQLPRMQDLDWFVRFISAGGVIDKPRSVSPLPLCRYEKTDSGRDCAEIHRCNLYLLDKHAALLEKFGASYLRERKIQADLLALRFAKNNGDYTAAAGYVLLAAARDPIRTARQLYKKVRG